MHQRVLQAARPERLTPREDVLGELAEQLRPSMAALRDSAARLEAATAARSDHIPGELADRIVEQTEVMARWVSAMLDVERLRLGKVRLGKKAVDLLAIARRSAAEFTESDVRVLAAGPVMVTGDEPRLHQVINTVLGTLCATDRHCHITVHIGCGTWPRCEPQPTLDFELLLARELVRLHGGELWADKAASILVLPLHFSPLSHAILAASAACLPPE
jgi:K+-sensing histidine kinase KdpD